VSVEHLHLPLVSVAEESRLVVEALRKSKSMSFRNLVSDAQNTLVVVARFLALLDLYRQGVLRFNQVIAMGELQISWTGSESGDVEISDEFDIPVIAEDDQATEGSENV
jgi:segregation and condensation protein A